MLLEIYRTTLTPAQHKGILFPLTIANHLPTIDQKSPRSPLSCERGGFCYLHTSEGLRQIIFQFGGHCILKNANLSTGCYSIMGQNMGQTVLWEIAENFSELSSL